MIILFTHSHWCSTQFYIRVILMICLKIIILLSFTYETQTVRRICAGKKFIYSSYAISHHLRMYLVLPTVRIIRIKVYTHIIPRITQDLHNRTSVYR
jgi:hypothetical protein